MTLNRAQRRHLKRIVHDAVLKGKRLAAPVPDSVVLRGGPMNNWIVKPDAPALQPDWYQSWPESVKGKHAPGRYVLVEKGKAEWQTV